MKQIIFLFSIVLLMLSCGSGTEDSNANELPDDSASLRIAVMPTLDCLPLYLADERGFFEQAGLDASLFFYTAQMDCDTAIERGRVNAVVTDLVRAQRMMDNGQDLQLITSTDAYWQLVSGRKARIKQLKQLDNKMMAMTRFSATHLLSEKAIDSARVDSERVFCIQINDLDIRLNMLHTDIMDAMWLPEPQATDARNIKAHVLLDTRQMDYQLGVIVFRKRAATERQVKAFERAYNQACDSLNENGLMTYADIIREKCHATIQTIDSLPPMQFSHVKLPREADIKRATEWLHKQQKEKTNDEKR